jgi:hypothetical protein
MKLRFLVFLLPFPERPLAQRGDKLMSSLIRIFVSMFMGPVLSLTLLASPATSRNGEDVAAWALDEVRNAQSEAQSMDLKGSVSETITRLPRRERLAFVEALAKAVASVDAAERERTVLAAIALMEMSQTTPAERAWLRRC